MDNAKSVFDFDKHGDDVDIAIKTAYEMFLQDDAEERGSRRLLHASLSRPRKLSDEDYCVREGYRDVLSQFKELQMAGRVLARARAEQYDPEGVEDVDPTTRMDYDFFDAADDARRVSERLNAQEAAAKEAAAKEAAAKEAAAKEAAAKEAAPEAPAPEAPAPEAPSSSAQ